MNRQCHTQRVNGSATALVGPRAPLTCADAGLPSEQPIENLSLEVEPMHIGTGEIHLHGLSTVGPT